ncbi:helix-turn-helix transcriptional regulator [Actinopolymorpha alba]|uniref:helix-turn-helix transcriptional regulator n=1 Tax=Actinopolymorpha alba TaxID=533267 RepID=UPI00036AB583|nr:WYL domain-containing protein [Actinopolymorpha alba]
MPDVEGRHPTTRILALLELLQAHHRLGGADLAARLGVDPRTVRRYATRLAELGIPVEAERGRYGGYRLRPGYKLPPLMFTDDEATAVVLGLMAARAVGLATASAGAATESALAKISRVLPPALRERVAAVPDTLGLTLPTREGRAPQTAVVLSLAAAIQRHRRVRIAYESWRGDPSERDLDPYGLVVHRGRWYVSGHDHRRGEVRTFRVDRIGEVSTLAEEFAPPEEFDAVAQVSGSLARVPWAHEVEVVLKAPLADVRRRISPWMGSLAEVEGGVLVSLRAERLEGVAQMLAGLGWPFEIRRPEELRGAVRALAGSLLAYVEEGGNAAGTT